MTERIIILIVVALVVAAIWGIAHLLRNRAVRRMRQESPFIDLVPSVKPAIVAFSSPGCTECRTLQAPALARLANDLGDAITVRSISAPDHPELVARAGILTVPATVVVDAAGVVRHLNLGFADARRLATQIRGTCETSASML